MSVPDGERWTIVYDGECRFCEAGSARLLKWLPAGRRERVACQAPELAERFPDVSREACRAAMHLVGPDGRVFQGAEAVARAVGARGGVWAVAKAYYLPGVRWLMDRAYRWVAANRYRLAGRTSACEGGVCRPGDRPR